MKNNNCIVKTKNTKIKGYVIDNLLYYKGIPYGKAERFHKAESCQDVKIIDAKEYGCACPTLIDQQTNKFPYMIRNYYFQNEDCLNLNVVTTTTKQKKKPVLVYIHGGGYKEGSAISNGFVDPKNIVSENDIVYVSINHRLNILGLLDLSQFGKEYQDSGMLMISDIILALKWIKKNIAFFNGDNENITLMGNSGGGSKIVALMQTKEADGLFNKVVISSGILDTIIPENNNSSNKLIKLLLDKLNLSTVKELETIRYTELRKGYNEVIETMDKDDYVGCCFKKNESYVGNFLENGLRKENINVPILIGTTYSELEFFRYNKTIKDEQLLKGKYGDDYLTIKEIFASTYPNKKLEDLLFLDADFRDGTIKFIREAVKCGYSVYNYQFDIDYRNYYDTPSYHMSDLPYFFKTCEKSPVFLGSKKFDIIEKSTSNTLINFMKTGECDWEKCDNHIKTRIYNEYGHIDVVDCDIDLITRIKGGSK